jgi:hypothetical protein
MSRHYNPLPLDACMAVASLSLENAGEKKTNRGREQHAVQVEAFWDSAV